MDTMTYFLVTIIIIQLLLIIIWILKAKNKKNDWNPKLYRINEREYIVKYLKDLKLPQEASSFISYCIDSTLFFEGKHILSEDNLKTFHESNHLKTPVELLIENYKHILNANEIHDEIHINNVIEQLHLKSKIIIQKIESCDTIENEILIESFALIFIFFDLIEVLKNNKWATKNSVNGLKCLINENHNSLEYDGSENVLEYSKTLLNIFQFFKSNNHLPSDQLILGYKFINKQ